MINEKVLSVMKCREKFQDFILGLPNVVAVATAEKISAKGRTGVFGLTCYVTKKHPKRILSIKEIIPAQIQGVPTDVVESGVIKALANTAYQRPAPPGISIGHRDITAGTFGILVQKGGNYYILSNNHVVANENLAQIGDPVYQPGPYDKGTPPDHVIGTTDEFVDLVFEENGEPNEGGNGSNCPVANFAASSLNWVAKVLGSQTRLETKKLVVKNYVDAGLVLVDKANVSSKIIDIGTPKGLRQPEIDMLVQKSGRTTGHTTGRVVAVDATVRVEYTAGTAVFYDQILVEGQFSEGGDSGSAILDMGSYVVGLLFAGGEGITIANKIQVVQSSLGYWDLVTEEF